MSGNPDGSEWYVVNSCVVNVIVADDGYVFGNLYVQFFQSRQYRQGLHVVEADYCSRIVIPPPVPELCLDVTKVRQEGAR